MQKVPARPEAHSRYAPAQPEAKLLGRETRPHRCPGDYAEQAGKAVSQRQEQRQAQIRLIHQAVAPTVRFYAEKTAEAAVTAYDSHHHAKLLAKRKADVPQKEEHELFKEAAKNLPAGFPDPVAWLLANASWFDPSFQETVKQVQLSLEPLRQAKQAASEEADHTVQLFLDAVNNMTDEQFEGLVDAICQRTFCESRADFAALLLGDGWTDHEVDVNPQTAPHFPDQISAAALATWCCSLAAGHFMQTWAPDGEPLVSFVS